MDEVRTSRQPAPLRRATRVASEICDGRGGVGAGSGALTRGLPPIGLVGCRSMIDDQGSRFRIGILERSLLQHV